MITFNKSENKNKRETTQIKTRTKPDDGKAHYVIMKLRKITRIVKVEDRKY